jgi:pimeloyl-ACP methyl ester carboxylesterase
MSAVEVRPGIEIVYERTGSGPPLVLVHGITENRHSWDPLVADLSRSFDVVAVDLRGHGGSSVVAPFDFGTFADDLATVVALLHLQHPYLVGHSLGGVVVTALAGRVASAGVVNVDQPLELRAFQAAIAPAVPLIRGADEEFQGFIAMLFGSIYGALPAAEQDRITELRRPDKAVANGIWSAVIDDPPEALDVLADTMLGGVAVPYLSLHGIDPGPGYASWLTARCPSAQVEVWPDQGHYPHLVDKERFLARVAAFTAG